MSGSAVQQTLTGSNPLSWQTVAAGVSGGTTGGLTDHFAAREPRQHAAGRAAVVGTRHHGGDRAARADSSPDRPAAGNRCR